MSGADIPWFALNNGKKIPSIGIGCWMGEFGAGQRAYDMVLTALKNGYRHIDTASGYQNEEEVGRAVRDSKIPREEIFITTKLGNGKHGDVKSAFEASLKALGTDYIDLYLMHWPQAVVNSKTLQPNESPTIVETWKEMEKLLDTDKVKSIGVSNFGIPLLKQLADDPSVKVVPAANQMELHPFLPLQELQNYAKENDIILTGYSPIGQPTPGTTSPLLGDSVITTIAERIDVTPAQVILSWAVGHGISVIPKSESVERQKKNIELVKLTSQDISAIDTIHEQKGKHRSLVSYQSVFSSYHDEVLGGVLGWTYEQLGWTGMKAGGVLG